jgi:hypothetical protein
MSVESFKESCRRDSDFFHFCNNHIPIIGKLTEETIVNVVGKERHYGLNISAYQC